MSTPDCPDHSVTQTSTNILQFPIPAEVAPPQVGGQTEVFLDQLAPDLERPLDKTGGLRMLSRISSYSSPSKVPTSYPTTFVRV